MSEQRIGIENVNSFYTEHYLSAIMSDDIKGVLCP